MFVGVMVTMEIICVHMTSVFRCDGYMFVGVKAEYIIAMWSLVGDCLKCV